MIIIYPNIKMNIGYKHIITIVIFRTKNWDIFLCLMFYTTILDIENQDKLYRV